jgi:carbonic anhydrase/acetyltransferase-like protein (isoleucine patch superfamily)
MPAIPFQDKHPQIAENVFVAPTAWVTGDTVLEDDVSLFFGVVIRGDINQVRVGRGTNIQESSMLHTSHGLGDCVIGERCTIGHGAIIHGCTIGNSSLVGMGATVLDNAVIGNNCLIGANSLVTMNTEIPDGHLALGSPAKVIRPLNEQELQELQRSADHYITVGQQYRKQFSEAV